MAIKYIATNTSTTDILSIYIGEGESNIDIGPELSVNLLEYQSMDKLSHSDVLYHINQGDITISDGNGTITSVEAIKRLFSIQEMLPRSEVGTKIWVHESPKPEIAGKQFITQWVGKGDDTTNHIVGGGALMKVDAVQGNAMTELDIEFDPVFGDVYLHEGYIQWSDAGIGDYLNISIWAKATPLQTSTNLDYEISSNKIILASGGAGTGTHGFNGNPVLVPNRDETGHWDYDSVNGLTHNGTTTGMYDMFDIEQEVSRYVNGIPLYQTSTEYVQIQNADAALLPNDYFIRLQYNNVSDNGVASCWMFMTTFRERTV